MFPNSSTLSTKFGLTFKIISWSYLETLKSINSDVDIAINLETSRILSTFELSISIITSFFCIPATSAGLSFNTSSITAGVKSLPANMYMKVKMTIANIKLANGPPATINALW